MNTKVTLRMNEALIKSAKAAALKRGKSVSQMVSEFFASLGADQSSKSDLPPVTAALLGILKDKDVLIEDYKRHLLEKHQ